MIHVLRAWQARMVTQTLPPERAAALRVAVSGVWLLELVPLRSWQHDLYDLGVPGQAVMFDLWIVANVALLLGFRPRLASAVSFGCFVLFVTLGEVSYHVDLVAQIATFYLVFADTSAVWSIDSVLRRTRAGSRGGRPIWAFPITMMLLHMAIVYLDAGLSHLWFNPSWASGEAVGRSWAHPQWTTSLAVNFLAFPLIGELATYATLAFELVFWVLALWTVSNLAARWRGGVLCFSFIAIFQTGIIVSYDIGTFSLFMLAVAVPYLPWERLGRSTSDAEPQDVIPLARRLTIAGLSLIVVSSLVVTPPVVARAESASALGDVARFMTAMLAIVGDRKPHNVFSDPVVGTVVSARVIDASGVERPLFFGLRGERIGDLTYIRAYMPVERTLRAGTADPPKALEVLRPTLQRAADRRDLEAGQYRVVVANRPTDSADVGSIVERELFSFIVSERGQVALAPAPSSGH